VLEYRNGAETDLDNVLQIPNVFLNVSKGQVASAEDLSKAFGKDKKLDDIILEILKKGELQVGDKERHAQLDRIHNEVIDIVAGKLVDPKTKRPYTTGMIDKALDQLSSQSNQPQQSNSEPAAPAAATEGEEEAKPVAPKKTLPVWTGVVTTKTAKQQALDAMKALIAHQPIPLARARMRLRITCPANILKEKAKGPKAAADDEEGETKGAGTVKDRLLSFVEQVEKQDVSGADWEVVGFVEPGAYKQLTEFIGSHTRGKARAEVLDMAVIYEGDEK
jgi:ribosome maturation protein SDO1